MFRHILSYCMVVALFMMAMDMPLSANTVVLVDFEDPTGNEGSPVTSLSYPPLTITFSTTNPNNCPPYLGEYGDPGYGGWLCNQQNENDVTYPDPYPQGGQFFLGWNRCDAINYDLEVRFSLPVDKFEGDIFDVDDGTERFVITAYDAYDDPVPGTQAQMTITPSPPYGGDCGIQHWEVSGSGIRKVVFDGWKSTTNLGFGIDELKVTYTSGEIPTLTQWGSIIFGVLLIGFITWVFLRRRRVAGVRV